MRRYFLQIMICLAVSGLAFPVLSCSNSQNEKTGLENDPGVQTAAQLPGHQQILVVITDSWDSSSGTLNRFSFAQGSWNKAGAPIPVIIGKNGMAWGVGIEDFRTRKGPKKVEGDGKSPAGIFTLGTAFGYRPSSDAPHLDVPYTEVNSTLQCIEDTGSTYYNHIIDGKEVEPDWNSTDRMRRNDDLYEWGMFIEHNAGEPEAGGGSCIFLHIWRPSGNGTAGCTSMGKEEMLDLLKWLNADQNPILVQVPQDHYPSLAKTHDLPQL